MHLKIWHKMIIGVSIPSFLVVLGSLLTYGYIKDVESRQGFVEIADDLKERVLELRRNEKNFFHFKNAESLHNLKSAVGQLMQSMNQISPDTASEIGKEDFVLLQKSIQLYPELIDELFNNYQQEQKDIENVREEGRKLEGFVKTLKQAEDLTVDYILHLRLLEKNYMLFRNETSFNELNNGMKQLKNVTPFCIECIPYTKAIHNLFDTHKVSDALVNRLQITGNLMETATAEISKRERQRISTFLNRTKDMILIALLLLITIGPLFIYKTADYIVTPVKRLAAIMRKIAGGDTTLRAPIREHDETADLSRSFNTMLDHLQLTHQSLAKSMELLNEKQAQLVESEKRASLGLLVSGVAHELNNPLNNISLITERMVEEREELSRDEMRDYNNILIQCERAKNIVDNLLDFARARKSTVMDKQDIVKVVSESFNFVGNQLKINNIELVRDLPDTPIYVNGNRSKLEQILVSIITNAIQAIKSDGIITVRITPDDEKKEVLLILSDNGPGIPEEDIKNIFEAFFTTKPVGKGTGLGLSVCRSLVMEHRGQIDVESKVGEGTTFTIRLPQYQETEETEG